MSGKRGDRLKKPYSRQEQRQRSDGEWLHDKAPDAPATRNNGPANVSPTVPNTKLMVSNLHYEVTPKDLTQIFGQIGTLVREPLIRYDRSGRSSGIAIISYETPAEAKRALTQFNGKLCKGQPMSIEFDAGPPSRPRAHRNASAPSLLNRIEKPPLLDRLSQNEPKAKAVAPAPASAGSGPIRTNRRGARAPRESKKPKTAEELDNELDAFMKDESKPNGAASSSANQHGEDVEMAT